MSAFIAESEDKWGTLDAPPCLHIHPDGTQYLRIPRHSRAFCNGIEVFCIQRLQPGFIVSILENPDAPPLTYVVGPLEDAGAGALPAGCVCQISGMPIAAGSGFRCPSCHRTFSDSVRAIGPNCPLCHASLAPSQTFQPEEALR